MRLWERTEGGATTTVAETMAAATAVVTRAMEVGGVVGATVAEAKVAVMGAKAEALRAAALAWEAEGMEVGGRVGAAVAEGKPVAAPSAAAHSAAAWVVR